MFGPKVKNHSTVSSQDYEPMVTSVLVCHTHAPSRTRLVTHTLRHAHAPSRTHPVTQTSPYNRSSVSIEQQTAFIPRIGVPNSGSHDIKAQMISFERKVQELKVEIYGSRFMK